MNKLQRSIYGLEAVKREQERLNDVAELDNIRGLRRKVNAAKAELNKALLKRENRIMSED